MFTRGVRESRPRASGTLVVAVATALLSACGGGGDEAQGPSPSGPTPPPTVMRMIVEATSVSQTGSTNGSGTLRTIGFSFEHATSAPIYVATTFTSNGIQAVSHALTGTAGTLTINFKPTASLAPGTYQDSISLLACRESPCVNHIAGSPQLITVTYVVPTQTTPTPSGPILVLSQTTLNVEALTYTSAPTRTVTISLQNFAGPDSVFVGGSITTTGIAAPQLVQTGATTLTLSIPFKSPSAVGPGSYSDFIIIRACRESPCVNHIAGSPQTITINYVVTVNPNPPTVTFSASTLEVTHDNVGSFGTRTDESIQYSIASRGVEPVFTRVTVTGTAVIDGQTRWNGDAQGAVRITLRDPGSLGAGTYMGTVRVEVCLDLLCTIPLPGSPGDITVTYRVTGNARPNTQVLWNAGAIGGATLVTSETRTPSLQLRLQTTNLPPGGFFVRHTPSVSGLITGGVNAPPTYTSQVINSTSEFAVTLKSPASLGSGIFTDTMTFEACFDAACTEIVPGSRYVLSPSMLIMATEGVEYTRRLVLPGGNADSVVWSPVNRSLYVAATVSGASRIVQVDPESGTIGATTPLNITDVYRMAVTPDGSYLYAGANAQQTLHRLHLPSLTPDLSIQLGELNSFTPFGASDIEAMPGQPRSVVVAVKVGRTGVHAGVRIYDDATPRPLEVGPTSPDTVQRWLVPAAEAGQFISWRAGTSITSNALERLSVDANGIRVDSSTTLPLDRHVGGHPFRVGTKLYHTFGSILDASTGDVISTISFPESRTPIAVLPDERNRKLFVWTQVQGAPAIVSYDLDTLQILAYAPMQFGSGAMVLWGNEGIAITNGSSLTVLSGSFFSSYRGEPRQ
jgi:hypothetical protein